MAGCLEKRKCKSFEMPGAEVRFKKCGLLGRLSNFSMPYPLLNLSKEGLVFICSERFSHDGKIILQLLVPEETPLNLRALVEWQRQSYLSSESRFISVEFMPFGRCRGWNSIEALNVLKRIEAQHIDKEEDKSFYSSNLYVLGRINLELRQL